MLGNAILKKKRGRKIEGEKIRKIIKYEKLYLSHLLEYCAGVPYQKKEERERDRGRENLKDWEIREVGPEAPAWILCWDVLLGKKP